MENVASPATKFLIPFLFAVLGLLVFDLFEQLEARLRAQIALDEVRGIHCQEVVFSKEAQQRALFGGKEAQLWSEHCERYERFMQAPLTVSARGFRNVPLLMYDERPSFIPLIERGPGEPRVALLMTDKVSPGVQLEIFATGLGLEVLTVPFPSALKKSFQADAIAVLPIEVAGKVIERGYTQIQVMVPKKNLATEDLERLVRQHAYAEGRNVRVQSAQEILAELNAILRYQKFAQWGVGIAVLVVLSLVLGSLSLLEFRQESYLYALLKSFGVRSWQLFINGFVELCVLSFAGLIAGGLCYYWLLDYGTKSGWQERLGIEMMTAGFSLQGSFEQSLSTGGFLYLATGIGCLLASIPLALALRKQPGLLLP